MTAGGQAAGAAAARETYLRSLIGPQALAHKDTAPAWVFGTGDRSGSLTSGAGGGPKRTVGLSPGPIYLPSPRGAMGDGPKCSIGGATDESKTRRAGAAPGPGEYEMAHGLGNDLVLSKSRNAPRYGWGTGGRDKLAAGGLIGLGNKPACSEFYEVAESIGHQPVSTKATKPAYSLGHESRFDDRHRMRQKAAAPGPGSYSTAPAAGTQVDSTKPSQPQVPRSALVLSLVLLSERTTDRAALCFLAGAIACRVLAVRLQPHAALHHAADPRQPDARWRSAQLRRPAGHLRSTLEAAVRIWFSTPLPVGPAEQRARDDARARLVQCVRRV